MRAVLTRVLRASVHVDEVCVGKINAGICAFIGVARSDTICDAQWLADKIVKCRCFEDTEGKMNRSVVDAGGSLLAISQFTLFGDLRRGTRPSFSGAMEPVQAKQLFDECCKAIVERGLEVATGEFGSDMQVESVNDGPVTLLLDSTKLF